MSPPVRDGNLIRKADCAKQQNHSWDTDSIPGMERVFVRLLVRHDVDTAEAYWVIVSRKAKVT